MTRSWLDVVPGGLAWLLFGLVIVAAVSSPLGLIWLAAGLAVYLAARFTLAALVACWGLRRIKQWEARNWQVEYARWATPNSLPLEAVHHLVVIPNWNEDRLILRRTLDRLAVQKEARTAISVVLAMEAAEPGAADKGAQLQAEYAACFAHVWVTVHPQGLPGEIQCKSANQSWAVRWAKHRLVDDLGMNLDHVLVTTMDADTLWHPRYFESLGVFFATHPQRSRAYWQAPIRYHSNVWDSHPLLRLLHAYASAWELAYLTAPWWRKLPMSSYSLSLRLLDDVGYWDTDVIADDWHMAIKSHFGHAGKQSVQPVFLPFLASATPGRTAWQAVCERYHQTFRHAWGAKEIGYALGHMLRRRDVSWSAFWLLFRVAHDNLMSGAGWVVLFLGSQLPLWLHPTRARGMVTSPPMILFQLALGVVGALTLWCWAVDVGLRPARSTPWTIRERSYELASLPLLAVLTIVCVTIPVLHAQTRLMVGMPIRFRVTAKS